MKKVLAVVLFAAFVLTGCSENGLVDPIKDEPVRAFYGEVSANNAGVPGATVTVNCSDCQNESKRYEWEATTNATGYWQAKDRPPIDHTDHTLDCKAAKDGYKPDELRYRVPQEGPVEVPTFKLKPE
jgi:hypothetical protein